MSLTSNHVQNVARDNGLIQTALWVTPNGLRLSTVYKQIWKDGDAPTNGNCRNSLI